MNGRLDTPMLLDKKEPETELPHWINEDGECQPNLKAPEVICPYGKCLQCSLNPQRTENYVKLVIPYEVKKCFKEGKFPKESCTDCSREKDCELMDKHREWV